MADMERAPCGWTRRPQPPTQDELETYLMCAASRGCHLCVDCSERALEAMRTFISAKGAKLLKADARPSAKAH